MISSMSSDAQPRLIISLNGAWQIEPGENEVPSGEWRHDVQVPALVDMARPAYEWETFAYHWYRHSFHLQENRRADLAFLKLQQASFGTEVWLNDKHLGGDMACYTSQEYDLRGVIKFGAENELLVRVGAKHTLPPESAVGKDQEKALFIPGIWGDVDLILCGNPRIKLVQVIPHIDKSLAEVRITIENLETTQHEVRISTTLFEKKSGNPASKEVLVERLLIGANAQVVVTFWQTLESMRLWSLEDPFLYELETLIHHDGSLVDKTRTTFGMREFKIAGADFYLNGKRIFLKGGNIAFHRFLSDQERGTLPWQPDWIKRILIDIPKAHHFNFFRNHLGQMYNRWYDLADEHGMLLQNEWPFWTTTGTKEQITREFTRWLQDNWNHPSIIIWDALNESSDKIVQEEIVPEMKKLDPTRIWESVDFVEQHPYIYSLGPVLNDRKFGFSEALAAIENFSTPAVLNEFLWWWLDANGKPAPLMAGVVERWLGRDYTMEDLLQHQSFLAQELVELFRRMRVAAIQPFVYLSNNSGPTAHWFAGNIADLQPKPILQTLKNAFTPFGLSIALWDRHFYTGEKRTVNVFVCNDETRLREGSLRYGLVDENERWLCSFVVNFWLGSGGGITFPVELDFPLQPGRYYIRAELHDVNQPETPAYSKKVAHVFAPPRAAENLKQAPWVLFDDGVEITKFFEAQKIPFESFGRTRLAEQHALIVAEGMIRDQRYCDRLDEISRFVKKGKTLIVLEPECGGGGKEIATVLAGWKIVMEKRADADKGGYDSYVFAEDHAHPLWQGLAKDHLKMFNGAYGGEIVSQHDVTPPAPHQVLARCGLHLKVIAAAQANYGAGKIMLSRLQTRGRLAPGAETAQPFSRRADPVAQQYLLNLMSSALV